MAKFSSEFRGCRNGEVYPSTFQPGDDCPAELEAAAREVGALEAKKAPAKK